MLTVERQNCEQYKERGTNGRRENRSQACHKVVVICCRLEHREIVRVIRRSCDGQPRSGDHYVSNLGKIEGRKKEALTSDE